MYIQKIINVKIKERVSVIRKRIHDILTINVIIFYEFNKDIRKDTFLLLGFNYDSCYNILISLTRAYTGVVSLNKKHLVLDLTHLDLHTFRLI